MVRSWEADIGPYPVAIAHDYLTQRGGAEKVVLAISRAFPQAPIYTLLFDPAGTYPEFAERDIRVSPLNRVGPLRRNHRAALPLLPFAAQAMKVDAELVITSSSGWAHGFRAHGDKLVYCYSPARWLYASEMYLGEGAGPLKKSALAVLGPYLKRWDRRAAQSCQRYVAISSVARERIRDAYGIDADVVPAPVGMTGHEQAQPVRAALDWLGPAAARRPAGEFYLCVSRLLPYKNVDEVVRAFGELDRPLVVVGRGPEAERIRRLAAPNVLMLEGLSDDEMAWLYQNCRAVVAASFEDYGLTPIEAGVWGRPSVVLRWGGFVDTVVEGVTGVFFDRPEAAEIARAVRRLESSQFDENKIRGAMERFTEDRFIDGLRSEIQATIGVAA
ncbi:glycosyltransferase [Mycobacterium sp. DL592]|uniref:glycosyltransferase n=1 Tax=Mycobacterium sp. DL592 TaxID=2675524 RepID=UPI001FBAD32F|nr:glycosyltransferase [Mycobacterium sp. DL592]